MRRPPAPWLWLLAVALPCAVAALSLGTPYVPAHRLAQVLGGDGLASVVVGELRLPRLVLALVAGACLGAAGLVLQEALRNPLAVPEMLGVSSGAALGVAAPLVLSLSVPLAVQPFLALAGAALGGLLTLAAAGLGRSPSAVLLTGAAVAAALQAALAGTDGPRRPARPPAHLPLSARQSSPPAPGTTSPGSGRGWPRRCPPWSSACPSSACCAWATTTRGPSECGWAAPGWPRSASPCCSSPPSSRCAARWPGSASSRRTWPGGCGPAPTRRGCSGTRPPAAPSSWSAPTCPARLLLAPVETPVGAWTALFGVPVGVALLKWRTPERGSPAPAPGDRAALRKAER